MGDLADAVAATDGPWALAAIGIIGLYVLAWKFGGQLLTIAKENNVVAKEARSMATKSHTETKQIASSIVTNHGSKNLGDAIDRLSEWMLLHLEESRDADEALRALRSEFMHHLVQANTVSENAHEAMSKLDHRITELETKKGV